jgi:uncharacterized protein (UPF0332 family)
MSLDSALLFISKSPKAQLKLLHQGAGLVTSTGKSIEELRHTATHARLILAEDMLLCARKAVRGRVPDLRGSISRAYYSMYHTFRAVVFYAHGNDDHEEHSVLPKNLPRNFPNRNDWENKLKNARLERNKADYDPGSQRAIDFKVIAKPIIQDANEALIVARAYLTSEGLNPRRIQS